MAKDPAHNVHNRGNGLRKISEFVLAHRRRLIGFWILIVIVAAPFAGQVQDRLSLDFSTPGQPGYEAAKKITDTYGNGGVNNSNSILTVTSSSGAVTDDQQKIDSAFATLRQQYPQVRIVDYTSTGNRAFITADSKTEFALLFTPTPTAFGGKPLSTQIGDTLSAQLPGLQTGATGSQELAQGTGDSGGTGVFVETLIAGLGALAVLAYVFASLLAFIPLMIAAVSIFTTLLIVFILTTFAEVSFIVLFLVSLVGLGVAIDYSLLVVTRWREERAKGLDNTAAIETAMATAGHAVLLSGLTVAIGLVALVLLPVPSLRSIGYGGMLIPLVSVAVILTLLPAILGGFGQRMNWPRVRQEDKASRAWTAWARLIVKQRWIAAAVAVAILAVMIIPVSHLKIGQTASSALAKSGPAFNAYQKLISGGASTGILTPIEILVDSDSAANVATQAAKAEGINTVFVSGAADSNKAGTSVLIAIPKEETVNSASTQPVKNVQNALQDVDGVRGITGSGAIQLDYVKAVFGNAPLVFGIIALLTFLLLVRAFHSVLLAFKALVLNVVSLAAIFGVLTFFWQEGHGSGAVFDVSATGAITFWIPTMVFAFLFGLSMDYEVFILARMREEYDNTGSTSSAVIVGIGRTGRLVTSAALILFMSFASLALSGFTDLKVLATGLGAGILLDATVVRAFLLPSLVALFGEANWWMPQWLATVLRTEIPARNSHGHHVDSESNSEPAPA